MNKFTKGQHVKYKFKSIYDIAGVVTSVPGDLDDTGNELSCYIVDMLSVLGEIRPVIAIEEHLVLDEPLAI
jgi:hypothetical protein